MPHSRTTTLKRAQSEAQKDERRRAILNAALDLFETVGLDNVRVEAIARAANIAKGTVYLYYRSREAIFIDLYEEAFADWLIGFAKLPELSQSGARSKAPAIIAQHYVSNTRFEELHSALAQGLWRKLDAKERAEALSVLKPGQQAFVDFLARILGVSNAEASQRAIAILAMLAGYSQTRLIFGDDEALLAKMVERQILGD